MRGSWRMITAASRPQRGDGIVGRQQHAAGGETGTLLQMQIRDNEQALFFPEQDAGEIGRRA